MYVVQSMSYVYGYLDACTGIGNNCKSNNYDVDR